MVSALEILKFAAAALLFAWATWAMYVLVMGLYRAHLAGRLGRVTYALGYPLVALGWLMDVAANVLIASPLFLEPPRELLVTTRLKRHMRGREDWRQRVAKWICDHLLDVFDPSGDHC